MEKEQEGRSRTCRTAAPAPGQPRPKDTPGSSPWVPSSAGLLIAAEVVARVLGEEEW